MDSIAELTTPEGDAPKEFPAGDTTGEGVTDKNDSKAANGDVKVISNPRDNEELTDTIDDASHAHIPSKVSEKEDSVVNQGQLSGKENIAGSAPDEKDAEPVTKNDEKNEITINASTIPVHNPKESSYSDNDFAYTHTQANHGFINDDDEPIHV